MIGSVPKRGLLAGNQSLKKKFAVAGSVSEHNWFLLTLPPPYSKFYKKILSENKMYKYGPFGVFLAVWCILDLKEIFLQNSLFLC